MKVVEPYAVLIDPPATKVLYKQLEAAGRLCYKSTGGDTENFLRSRIQQGHESVIEHGSLMAHVVCDRGVSHEIVRHRLASYSQESTRYCNYSNDKFGNEITVIKPCFFEEGTVDWAEWYSAMVYAEQTYMSMIRRGRSPQEARSVLPNSLKTELYMTMNIREWRHFFRLRCVPSAHPQMREIALQLYHECVMRYPDLFADVYELRIADMEGNNG